MVKRALAGTIVGIWAGLAVTFIGSVVRRDDNLEQPFKDFAAGAFLVFIAAGIRWAFAELAESGAEQ